MKDFIPFWMLKQYLIIGLIIIGIPLLLAICSNADSADFGLAPSDATHENSRFGDVTSEQGDPP